MNSKLKSEFENLHNKLKNLKHADEETRTHLESLKTDIQNILDNSEQEIIENKEDIISDLKKYTLKLESEHNEISESINIIIHTLSNMGI